MEALNNFVLYIVQDLCNVVITLSALTKLVFADISVRVSSFMIQHEYTFFTFDFLSLSFLNNRINGV